MKLAPLFKFALLLPSPATDLPWSTRCRRGFNKCYAIFAIFAIFAYFNFALLLPSPTTDLLGVEQVLYNSFRITRSYAALQAADLDWIVGPGYSLGGCIFEKNHENQPKTMKNQPGTFKKP